MSANCLVLGRRQRSRLLAYLVLALLVLTLGLPGLASAETFTENVTSPFNATLENECTGEWVVVSGYLLLQYRMTFTDSGTVHIEYHLSTQGLSRTALLTGAQYQAKFVSNQTQNGSVDIPPGGQYEQTQQDIYQFIRQRETLPADDFYLHIKYHTTFNAAGVPTAQVDDVDTECR